MIKRKQFGYTASILKDTNRLIASSQANWGSLPEGSYVIFDEDEDFYKVIDKEQFFFTFRTWGIKHRGKETTTSQKVNVGLQTC